LATNIFAQTATQDKERSAQIMFVQNFQSNDQFYFNFRWPNGKINEK